MPYQDDGSRRGARATCVLIAYWDEDKDVLWTEADCPDEFACIYSRMREFILTGNTTEVLDFLCPAPSIAEIDTRVTYWRETLREQGYKIGTPDA